MGNQFQFGSLLAAALLLAVAGTAQAAPRDTGMGKILAEQGNQALRLIKAELRQTFKTLTPVLPARPGAKPVAFAPVMGVTSAVRCAE